MVGKWKNFFRFMERMTPGTLYHNEQISQNTKRKILLYINVYFYINYIYWGWVSSWFQFCPLIGLSYRHPSCPITPRRPPRPYPKKRIKWMTLSSETLRTETENRGRVLDNFGYQNRCSLTVYGSLFFVSKS